MDRLTQIKSSVLVSHLINLTACIYKHSQFCLRVIALSLSHTAIIWRQVATQRMTRAIILQK